jgi:hypothetical protein
LTIVEPKSDTTYLIVVSGADGRTGSATAMIRVVPAPPTPPPAPPPSAPLAASRMSPPKTFAVGSDYSRRGNIYHVLLVSAGGIQYENRDSEGAVRGGGVSASCPEIEKSNMSTFGANLEIRLRGRQQPLELHVESKKQGADIWAAISEACGGTR